MKRGASWALIFALSGCAGAVPPPAAEIQVEQKPSCVEECVRDNQMRAVSAQQIERDCEDRCAGRDERPAAAATSS